MGWDEDDEERDEEDLEEGIEDAVPECPYCGSSDCCAHLLLLVDLTFHSAEGGSLMAAFDRRWAELCDAGGDELDEGEAFAALLEEVAACADSSEEYEYEGGPGMSSSYAVYFIKTPARVEQAVARFRSAGDD